MPWVHIRQVETLPTKLEVQKIAVLEGVWSRIKSPTMPWVHIRQVETLPTKLEVQKIACWSIFLIFEGGCYDSVVAVSEQLL